MAERQKIYLGDGVYVTSLGFGEFMLETERLENGTNWIVLEIGAIRELAALAERQQEASRG